ncbi:carbohydrate ABC transporter permease [Anaerocolumna chitinilytica]|jgi:ABC-type sugar transport system permease subunit|uniref:ABC transporter permease n=1 Tax=Anaerocolumna chitinilytica TaxID=1727145 RepID=A0A7I8DSS4_9FIRM|nr:sugar ABC transporter permease [Anaerocolumna chitinilytica]BCJ99336.1 ABC transporter permease [Anaerocolumna chitinilytica]
MGTKQLEKTLKPKKMKSFKQRQNKRGYLFMLPWIIGFIVFTAIPFIFTIVLSFTEVKQTVVGFEIKFIGLDNYVMTFFENVDFTPAMLAFLRMVIPYTFVIVIVAFILAYLLNHITFLKGALRTIYFLPVIILSGPVMYQLVDSTTKANQLAQIGEYNNIFILQMISAYSRSAAEVLIGIFRELSIILWFTGIPIILFINGLQKINPNLYEAAQIDSANAWQTLWKITIPIIKPIALVVTIFTIAQLGTFSTNPVYTLIKTAMENTSGGLGIAATYAWIYSFTVLLIIGLAFLMFRDKKERRH